MDHLPALHYLWLIPVLPLVGAAISGFFGARWLKGQSHWPIWLGVGGAAVISFWLLFGMLGLVGHEEKLAAPPVNYFTWFRAGTFQVNWGYFVDPLTVVMLCFVTGISLLITIFSAGYMKGEDGYFRFFAFLGLFVFMMTTLVMGENLIMLYLGWEGVGLCSYLLIGYYYERPSARDAATKAFLVNRVGDFGFALGIMACFAAFGTISYFGTGAGSSAGLLELAAKPQAALNGMQVQYLRWIPFLLMLGAFGKSAQFPLYVWLPDAMEGPTPVSALIHAATMVTAGVYMIARCGTLFVGNSAAMLTIAIVGAFTAILAASIALRQFDLKKVFAYSTISQLGYMFVGVGVLAPTAAVFHLVTHAFFKALLFLSSGVVMHAMLGHLDMRKMSGLKRVLPLTNILMLIGCAALAGFPFTSGFFSKDEIIAAAWHRSFVIWLVVIVTALLTAYYTFRLYFRVFQGPELVPDSPAEGHAHGPDHGHDDAEASASHEAVKSGDVEESGVDEHLALAAHQRATAHAHDHGGAGEHGRHNHEPMLMIFPLIVLALGALAAGLLNWPKESLADFLGKSPSFSMAYDVATRTVAANHSPAIEPGLFGQRAPEEHAAGPITSAMIVGGLVSLTGILLAYMLHLRDRRRADELAAGLQPLTGWLEGKWYVDEIYDAAIVSPLRRLGNILFAVDRFIIDGIVWIISFIPQAFGWTLKFSTQRGFLQGYALVMAFGIAVILLVIFL